MARWGTFTRNERGRASGRVGGAGGAWARDVGSGHEDCHCIRCRWFECKLQKGSASQCNAGDTVTLTIYRGGAETFEAMAAGAADVILDATSLVSAGRTKGVSSKVVANAAMGYFGWQLMTLAKSTLGASDLKGKIDVKKLSVDLSGASDITISGNAAQLDIEASGASDFRGFDLVTDVCDVRASGASDIKITVNVSLSAHASGASDVRYKGNGKITDIKSSGSSSVSKG